MKSGNPEHPNDKLCNATINIQTSKPISNEKLPKSYELLEHGFYKINEFLPDLGSVSGYLDPEVVGQITKIRIQINFPCETWIVINEIDFSSKLIANQSKLISMTSQMYHKPNN